MKGLVVSGSRYNTPLRKKNRNNLSGFLHPLNVLNLTEFFFKIPSRKYA